LRRVGFLVKQQLIWVKNTFVLGRQDYQWKHELCLYGWKDGGSHYFIDSRAESTIIEDAGLDFKKMKKEEMQKLLEQIYSDKMSTSVIHEDKPTKNDLHPTMKPVALMGRLIANSTRKGERVLDLFGGSGSTLIACEQLKRKCYMMELDPHYCDVIIDRWEKATGQQATKL
jgi:DNA modification methylase